MSELEFSEFSTLAQLLKISKQDGIDQFYCALAAGDKVVISTDESFSFILMTESVDRMIEIANLGAVILDIKLLMATRFPSDNTVNYKQHVILYISPELLEHKRTQNHLPSNVNEDIRPIKTKRMNPWITGSFYLIATLTIIAAFTLVSMNLPWYTVGIIIIGCILVLSAIAAFQLRFDERLSEDNFLKLIRDIFKQLPLPKNNDNKSKNNPK